MYYIVLLSALALAASARAQVAITTDPGMTKGTAAAPVTIIEFADYQCPYCKRVQRALDEVLREFDGRVRLVFKDFPLAVHDRARAAAEAARCAASQGAFWTYHDRLFAEQPRFSREQLIEYAVDIGLDRDEFIGCLDEHRFAPAVDADVAQARALGVSVTPTFIIDGVKIEGSRPPAVFRDAIDEALRRAR